MAPNKDYRENHSRAIYVNGPIVQELVDRLTPTVNQLRLTSCEPITVYIDSLGGQPSHAETIRRLIKAPNPDGEMCRVITVVTGRAASAAADLLTLGDYAIAFPHASILYHGAQRPTDSALTAEVASSLASSLQESNERFAVRLARCAFPRFCLRMSQFADQFREYLSQKSGKVMLPITALTTQLKEKLSTANGRLMEKAVERQKMIENLTLSVAMELARFKKKPTYQEFEGRVLKGIINYKTKFHRNDLWLLSEGGLAEVSNDFKLLLDFHYGSQKKDLDTFLRSLGELFFLQEERQEFEHLESDKDEKLAWVKERVEPRLQPLWYFVVSYCRLLQTADYILAPEEAYWLGLVDEVSGSGLPNVREMVESFPTPSATAGNTQPLTPISISAGRT